MQSLTIRENFFLLLVELFGWVEGMGNCEECSGPMNENEEFDDFDTQIQPAFDSISSVPRIWEHTFYVELGC